MIDDKTLLELFDCYKESMKKQYSHDSCNKELHDIICGISIPIAYTTYEGELDEEMKEAGEDQDDWYDIVVECDFKNYEFVYGSDLVECLRVKFDPQEVIDDCKSDNYDWFDFDDQYSNWIWYIKDYFKEKANAKLGNK